jgi:hypothetical protein
MDHKYLNKFKKLSGILNESSISNNVFWHGSPSGEMVGSKTGIHIGTYQAAKQALEARIGVPASGEWDGTREYGKTLLAGKKTLKNIDPRGYLETGYNCGNDMPEKDYYPSQRNTKAKYSGGDIVQLTSRPNIFKVGIVGRMSNNPNNPMGDFKANATMQGQLKMGRAKSGYYYKNESEDAGSISAVVPDLNFIKQLNENNIQNIDEEFNPKLCPTINITQQITDYVNKFDTSEQLLRSGGIPIELLDKAAYGFSVDEIKTLLPKQLNIKWKDDFDNVKYEQQKTGLTPTEWSKKINLSEPIDVSYEKDKFWIEDGHHRYFAAKTLNLPLNVILTIKQNPIIKLGGPEIGYDDFHRCLFQQVKKLNENIQPKSILKEFISNETIYLKDYLKMGTDERKRSLPYEYSYFFQDFLNEDGVDFKYPTEMVKSDYVDEPDKEVYRFEGDEQGLINWLDNNNKDIYNEFADYLYRKIGRNELPIDHTDYPTWSYMSFNKVVKNEWLIHFTTYENAKDIVQNGFKYGIDDMTKLGLTTHIGDFEKKYGGYNFAYTLSDFKRSNPQGKKYGDGNTAIMFRASGIRVQHWGDEENQVIFYGNTAKNIILLHKEDEWEIQSKNGNVVYKNDVLSKCVDWLLNHIEQYRKSLLQK